jgi:AcrR family transcriptional regulator
MIENKPLDRRIQRTRKLLLDSLIALILEKNYDNITVQEIIDRANVGRSTFYAHFESKEQLLFSGHDALIQAMTTRKHSNTEGGQADIFTELFQHVADNHQLAKAMLGKGGGDLMIGRVNELLVAHFRQQAQKQILDDKKIRLYAAGFASAIVGFLSNWLEEDMPFPMEYMAEKSRKIGTNFLNIAT